MKRWNSKLKALTLGAILFISALLPLANPLLVHAATNNPVASPKITFTFDDGYASAYTQAAPTLAKYGLAGVDYVPTGCVGTTGTCQADKTATYLTWDQVTGLQNTYKWEVASHTVNHADLSTLTDAQKDQELSQSKAALIAHGINVTDFATPEGDYDNSSLAYIAKYYASHRGFKDQNNNIWPYNDYLLNNMQVQAGVTVAQVKTRIDQAIANNQWLILTFHDIKVTPNTNPDKYQYATADLDQIAAYVKAKQDAAQAKAVTIAQGLVTSDTNMLTNGSFESGLTGWTTNNAANVKLDTAKNGSYPNPQNAVSLTAGTTNNYLFSPKVAVDSTQTYILKSFLNVTARTSGELGYYVDEYDANGNWISGQWKAAENSAFVESINFTYKPTSANVKQASLQVYVLANSGIKAYVDSFQWFPQSGTVTPPPTQTNLVANGTFDNGIADGWATNDPANITKDTGNNGSPANPVNSIKLVATTANRHLFSPQVAVDSTKSYSLTSYLNIKQLTSGEIGFYIDEYDANGNWISGQYKTGIRAVSAGDVNFAYTPSSANVKKASLQIILVGNSGILAYFDNVRWFAN